MREYTGYCRTCGKYGSVPKTFDERRHSLRCPEGHTPCMLTFDSLEVTKRQLMLGKNEVFGSPLIVIGATEKE